MITIEERAQAYRKEKEISVFKSGMDISTMEFEYAYVKGANDQKRIDIEKACQWLEDALNGNNIEGCKDGEKLINDFRKAMEDRA